MEQKEETKFFDFTQVEMEVSFDEKMKVDISQTLGNVIQPAPSTRKARPTSPSSISLQS